MAPPVPKEVQLSALDYIKRQSPFLVLLLILIATVVWDDHHDREADIEIMQATRDLEKERFQAISDAIARVAEACRPEGS